jgi:hypothetical protein
MIYKRMLTQEEDTRRAACLGVSQGVAIQFVDVLSVGISAVAIHYKSHMLGHGLPSNELEEQPQAPPPHTTEHEISISEARA